MEKSFKGNPRRECAASVSVLVSCRRPGSRPENPVYESACGVALAGIGASKQRIRHPLCVFLYGEDADSGKSTYLELLQAMVGEDNWCSVSAHDFDKPNCTARLIGKTVNVAGELTTVKTIDGEIFKKSITGEDIPAKILYRDTLTFKPMALHLFATNKLPPFAGGIDLGVQRRIGIFEFSKPVPATKRIPDVVEQIIENEFDLLIGFALDGLLQVIRDQDYTLPPSSVEALDHWVQATDLTKAWAELYIEKLAPDPLTGKFYKSDGYFPTKLYKIFKEWCIEERGVPESKIPMFETFAERMGQMHPGCRRARDTRQWFGIVLRLKPAASPEEQQAQQMANVQHDILHMPNDGIIDLMTDGNDGTTWH